jgi:carboxypeptidase Taq
LSPLVRLVAESGHVVDESAAKGEFGPADQLRFARRCAEAIGFDFTAGRIDEAPHPFCTGFSPRDVRITWRYAKDDFRPALFGILHEAGHGLYEQGLPLDWQRTPIGGAVSLGVHESQSRLWENLVGRSRGFWEWALPHFKTCFPASSGVTLEALLPALQTVKPTMIRVEADQGTYDLHVCARFEIERKLFAGQLEVGDLPEAWNAAYEDLLGLRPADVSEGVLQDIHWSMGAFGYFPTYTLGNMITAQLFAAAERQLGELEPMFARGEFQPLLEWLRTNVHRHGSFFTAAELVEQATGKPLSPDEYLARRRVSVGEVYGVTL